MEVIARREVGVVSIYLSLLAPLFLFEFIEATTLAKVELGFSEILEFKF